MYVATFEEISSRTMGKLEFIQQYNTSGAFCVGTKEYI